MTTAQDKKYWKDNALMEKQREEANASGHLLPCPFCGAQAGEEGPEVTGTHAGTDWVECNGCGAKGPDQVKYEIVEGAAERALKAWNRWLIKTAETLRRPNGKH